MKELLKTLEANREQALPMDVAYYDQLHARIMLAVEEAAETKGHPPELKRKTWFEKPTSLFWRPWKRFFDSAYDANHNKL